MAHNYTAPKSRITIRHDHVARNYLNVLWAMFQDDARAKNLTCQLLIINYWPTDVNEPAILIRQQFINGTTRKWLKEARLRL